MGRRFGSRASLVRMAAFTLVAVVSCSRGDSALQIGSGGLLGNYFSAARAIARVANDDQASHGLVFSEQKTTGSIENVEAILAGDLAFGIAQADRPAEVGKASPGTDEARDPAALRAVFSLYTESITLVATPSSGIRTVADLKGKRVDIGHPDSGIRQNAIDALEAAGLDWKKDLVASGDPPDDRASKYLAGELDAFFHTVSHPNMDIQFAVNSVPGARLVPLSNLDGLLASHPTYSRSVIPIALYPGVRNAEDVETAGVKAIVLSSADVPEEAVYALTRSVFENVESLGRYDPVLKSLTRQGMVTGLTVPVHPGALRYFEEAGLSADAPAEAP